MNKNILFLLLAITLAFFLLGPGVWWGDTLNCYIQGAHGIYGRAQPVLMALIFNVTRYILPGPLLLFSVTTVFYFTGFYLMVFQHISRRWRAAALFFAMSFCPLLLANIAVLQTETLQTASLALFIPLTILLHRWHSRRRTVLFILLCVLLALFALVRYDTMHITILLSYWLSFSFFRGHGWRPVSLAIVILFSFYMTGRGLNAVAGIGNEPDSTMKNALLVADIAAISAETGTDYVPSYCWQGYLPAGERTVARLQQGMREWRGSFFSYIYNIDPATGVFTYDIPGHEADLQRCWAQTVIHHPFSFIRYHLTILGFLLDNDNFNMGLWSGLKDSHIVHARIGMAETPALDSFLTAHPGRFTWQGGYLTFAQDAPMISDTEERAIERLLPPRRMSDVTWMQWYSQVPRSTYMVRSERSEQYVLPFMEWHKRHLRWLSCLFPFALLLFIFIVSCTRRIPDRYMRFTFIVLCLCGILHLGLRALVMTDPVFRFGMLAILFTFYALVVLLSAGRQVQKSGSKVILSYDRKMDGT